MGTRRPRICGAPPRARGRRAPARSPPRAARSSPWPPRPAGGDSREFVRALEHFDGCADGRRSALSRPRRSAPCPAVIKVKNAMWPFGSDRTGGARSAARSMVAASPAREGRVGRFGEHHDGTVGIDRRGALCGSQEYLLPFGNRAAVDGDVTAEVLDRDGQTRMGTCRPAWASSATVRSASPPSQAALAAAYISRPCRSSAGASSAARSNAGRPRRRCADRRADRPVRVRTRPRRPGRRRQGPGARPGGRLRSRAERWPRP